MTDSRATLPAVGTSRFLEGLEKSAIESIVAAAQVRQIAAKRTILSEGEPASHLFLLRTGQARYYKLTKTGNEILLHLLLPGDVFGLGTLLKHPPDYLGSGETLSDCELLAWEHTSIRKLAKDYPQLAENALRIVVSYLKSYSDRHAGLVATSAQQRLAAALLNLGHRTGRVNPHGVEVEATNAQLSALADLSPFTTSRVLGRWKRDGSVSKARGKVLIHSPEALIVD
jgi:CRP/FNR family transcriptional regulator, nitrogen oxide reductase regulator